MLVLSLVCLAAVWSSAAEESAGQFGEDDFFWSLSISAGKDADKGAQARLLELLPGTRGPNRLLIRLTPARAEMIRAGRKERELGSVVLTGMPRTVTLLRRGRIHYLLADGRLVLRARHVGPHLGSPGATVKGKGLSLREVLRQRTARLFFTDTFSRAAGEPGPWKPIGGQWESVIRAHSAHAANPGSLRVRFSPAVISDPFAAGRVYGKRNGLGANLALLDGGGMAVTRVTGASPAERVGLRVGDILLSLRGRPLLKSRKLILQAGTEVEMTLLRSGENKVRSIKIKPGMFEWGRTVRAVPLPGAAAGRSALLTSGHVFWGLYRAECSVRVSDGAAAGMAFAVGADGRGLLYRLRPGKTSWTAEIVKIGADGAALGKPLVSKPIGVPWPNSWYRLAVEVCDDGRPGGFQVSAAIGDRKVLQVRSSLAGFGKIGLWAGGTAGSAEFDDVAVSDDHAKLKSRGSRAHFSSSAESDPFMSGWSGSGSDWLLPARSDGRAMLRSLFYSGFRLRIGELESPAEVRWGDDGSRGSGSLRFDPKAAAVTLKCEGKLVCRADLPADRPLSVSHAGKRITVLAAGKTVLSSDIASHWPARLSVSPARVVSSGKIVAQAASGLDLGFDSAPTELVATTGSWGLANRWICDPRWSWFAGRADSLCAIWTARSFDGDQRLEATAALMMTSFRSPHEIPRDIGLTICGDGRSLWSGYTLVFGANNNRCTRLYRAGKLVAETKSEGARFPVDFFSNPSRSALHQKWYRLGLGKRGGTLVFSVDGREQFTWQDPRPLAGGRMAVWKMRGGVLLARLRADARKVGALEPDLRAAPASVARPPIRPVSGYEGALEVRPLEAGVWRVRSLVSGSGAAAVQGLEVDPATGGLLKFRLRVSPGAIVDLYLESAGKRYRLGLTGPDPDPLAEEREVGWLGRARGVVADGRWHEVSVRLGPLWRDYWRWRGYSRVPAPGAKCRLALGCYADVGYACCGLAANSAGSWFELTVPDLIKKARDASAPSVGKPRLTGNTLNRRARIVIPLDDAGGAGLDARVLSLVVNGKQLKVGQTGLTYSEVSSELVVDLGAAGVMRGPAGSYTVSLKGIRDLAGNRQKDASFELSVDQKVDRRPPGNVTVKLLLKKKSQDLCVAPSSFRPVGRSGRHLVRRRYPERSGGLPGCSILAMVDGSPFCAYLVPPNRPLDLGRFPEMDFSCRLGPTSPLALSVRTGRKWVVAALNEAPVRSDGWPAWTPPAALSPDRTWQRVSVPVGKLCSSGTDSQIGRPATFVLQFGDAGDRRSRAGTHLSLGALRFVPIVNPAGLAFSWSAWDVCGVVDYRSALNNDPRTSPGRKVLESGKPLPAAVSAALKEGNAWLHLSFKDAADNWSEVGHYRLIVDRTPPRAGMPGVIEGTSSRCDGFDCRLVDTGGIAPGSISLTVNGKEYRLHKKSPALSFEPATGRLRWDARLALGKALKAGQELCAVLKCSDYAGNAMAPARWAWKTDPTGDRTAPAVPHVRFLAAGSGRKPLKGVGRRVLHPRRFSPISGTRMSLARTPDLTGCLVRTDQSVPMIVSLEPMPWRSDYYPVLQFEYRASPGARFELALDISGREVVLPLVGLPGGLGPADGQWRQVRMDLGDVSRRKLGALPLYCVWNAFLREPRGWRNRSGSFFHIRNSELWTGLASGTRFKLSSADAGSGLAGFSVVLDRKPGTIPPEKLNLPATSAGASCFWQPAVLEVGVWWLHVRASDLAGNWSKPVHFRIAVPVRKGT